MTDTRHLVLRIQKVIHILRDDQQLCGDRFCAYCSAITEVTREVERVLIKWSEDQLSEDYGRGTDQSCCRSD